MQAVFTLSFIFLLSISPALSFEPLDIVKDWPQAEGKHFIVFYPQEINKIEVNHILIKAEEFYSRISNRLGFNKFQDYWSWEKRVKIVMFSNSDDFLSQTGQPKWTQGFASSHTGLFEHRFIFSFLGQKDFLTNILPHEIGHLILNDFMQDSPVPLFFNEGVAQIEEAVDLTLYQSTMAILTQEKKHIPFKTLIMMKSANDLQSQTSSIFYAESLYIIDFLIKTYGKDKFVQLCRNMRDGLEFETNIKRVYYPVIKSINDLENQWISYLINSS